jgi:hypothetical protein
MLPESDDCRAVTRMVETTQELLKEAEKLRAQFV